MKKTIVVNNGSTSKKYGVYEADVLIADFVYEKTHDSFLRSSQWLEKSDWNEDEAEIDEKLFGDAFTDLVDTLLQKDMIDSEDDIELVVIRVVAPGDFFQQHRVVDKDYLLKLEDIVEISPLHIIPVKDEIDEILSRLPKIKIIAISDSAYHKTMPEVARKYALPKEWVEKLDLYRYGYHGISVSSVINELRSKNELPSRVIVCHLGGGASVTAVKDGASIETTMGFSPLGGLPMATRSGSIDSNIFISIMAEEELNASELQKILYEESGMKGMTGTADTREILKKAIEGDSEADLALDLYTYHIAKAIGAYSMIMGGLDAIIFTGTIGERSPEIRRRTLEKLQSLGPVFDKSKNKLQIKGAGDITAEESVIKVKIVPTKESEEMLRISKTVA